MFLVLLKFLQLFFYYDFLNEPLLSLLKKLKRIRLNYWRNLIFKKLITFKNLLNIPQNFNKTINISFYAGSLLVILNLLSESWVKNIK